jgi:hypothetical protein
MTQPNLLELAKQGNPQAIATLMNRSLRPKGIVATVVQQGDRLRVLLAADQIPNRQAMTLFVRNGIVSLGVSTIRAIEISGQQTDANQPAWTQEVELGSLMPPASPGVPAQPMLSRPAPPPLRLVKSVLPPPAVEAEPEASGLTLEEIYEATAPVSSSATSSESIASEVPPDRSRNLAPDPAAIAIEASLEDPIFPGSVRPISMNDVGVSAVVQPTLPPPTARSSAPVMLVVLLLLLGWVGAIIGYALWSNLTAPPPLPSPAPVSAAPSVSALPAASPVVGSYQEALQRGTQAQALAQTAQSVDDWSLVVSQWRQAIDQLQAIPASSLDHAKAQTLLSAYQANLATAQQRAASQPAISNAPPPASTFTVNSDIACPTVVTAAGAPPVELTNVQFSQTGTERNSIVGCITNHTNQPITSISVSYQGSSTQDPSLIESGYSALTFSELAALKTVPFTGSFELGSGVTNLSLKAIYWTPPGKSESQPIPITIELDR